MFVGVDIIEISRFTNELLNNQKYLDRCFTKEEQRYCLDTKNPAEHFAVRFAGKEAVIKALSGFEKTLRYNQIEIINNKYGRPIVTFHTDDSEILSLNVDISLSHSNMNALAFVIIF